MINRFIFLIVAVVSVTYAHTQAVVSCDKMNVMYRGIPNPISVAVAGYGSREIHLTCEGGKLMQASDGQYSVWPANNANTVTLSIYSLRKTDKEKLIDQKQFRIKRIPDPILKLDSRENGDSCSFNMSASERDRLPALIPWLIDFDFDFYCLVTAYTVSFIRDGEPYERTEKGDQLTQELYDAISRLPTGSPIHFDHIKVTVPDGTFREFSLLLYKK